MQGTLWKWTNYFSGWQPRWFILDSGVLSYYLAPTEVHLGSRGSLKVASCDMIVHPTDHQRMDIIMPGGRHIYLRAASTAERQQWLLALGVAKQEENVIEAGGAEKVRAEAMKNKMSELHVNCQLLVKQVAGIKAAASGPEMNVKALSELSDLLVTSCDAFLNVLHECMDLSMPAQAQLAPVKKQFTFIPPGDTLVKSGTKGPLVKKPANNFSEDELYPRKSTPVHNPPFPPHTTQTPLANKHTSHVSTLPMTDARPTSSLPIHLTSALSPPERQNGQVSDNQITGTGPELKPDSESQDTRSDDVPDSQSMPQSVDELTTTNNGASSSTTTTSSDMTHRRTNSDFFVTPSSSPPPSPSPPARVGNRVPPREQRSSERFIETFFSRVPKKFEDLVLKEGDQIPTAEFLECCGAVVPFFDTLSATAFAPVKADINGNIAKLTQKYEQNPELYHTLQAIVEQELNSGTHNAKNSATDALLWLKRAMEFIQVFIMDVAEGEHSLDVAAGKAYSKSLRKYHNWIVRGVFNLAMKAVPYHKDFLLYLGSDGTADGDNEVTQDMAQFADSLGVLVTIVNLFYQKHNLDSL